MVVRARVRGHEPSPLWLCCCCGGLPLLGLLKALVLAPIPSFILFAGCTTISLGSLPHDVCLAYDAIWSSVMIGRNARALALLAIPLPLMSWPVIVSVSSLFGGFCGFACWMALTVFDDNVPLLGGGGEAIEHSMTLVREFRKHSWEKPGYFCEKVRDIPPQWDGRVYEIPVCKVLVGTALIVWGTLVGSLGVLLITAFKSMPLALRGLTEYVRLLTTLEPWFWLFWLFGLILGVILSPALYVLAVCAGFSYCGMKCALETLQSGSSFSGFLEVWRILHELDVVTNELICGDVESTSSVTFSCLPEVSARPPHRTRNPFMDCPETGSLDYVWNEFFEECMACAQQAVADGWLLASSCEDMDPAAIIGIPALCAFDIIYRSALRFPKKAAICWLSSTCDDKSRSRNSISDAFWPRILAVKKDLVRHLPLKPDELAYMRVKLCSGGGDTSMLGEHAQTILEQQCDRWGLLQNVCAGVNRLSYQLSRLQEVQRRLPSVLSTAAGRNPANDPVCVSAESSRMEMANDPPMPTQLTIPFALTSCLPLQGLREFCFPTLGEGRFQMGNAGSTSIAVVVGAESVAQTAAAVQSDRV